jgi:hypothetical protein
MTDPDLTPAAAEEFLRRPILPGLGVVLVCGVGYVLLVGWVARFIGQRYQVAPFAVALIAFGLAFILLATFKPRLYWDSDAVVRARLRNSATVITRGAIGFGLALVALGLLGFFW